MLGEWSEWDFESGIWKRSKADNGSSGCPKIFQLGVKYVGSTMLGTEEYAGSNPSRQSDLAWGIDIAYALRIELSDVYVSTAKGHVDHEPQNSTEIASEGKIADDFMEDWTFECHIKGREVIFLGKEVI